MELSDLKSKVLEIFEIEEVKDLGSALMKNLGPKRKEARLHTCKPWEAFS